MADSIKGNLGCIKRRGDWIQTCSGKAVYPLDLREDEIDIEDIASALSKMCRYGGHCLRFYSVAEHCVLLYRESSEEFKLTALLHDASEAYLVDVPRPIKPHLVGYRDIEDSIMRVVAKKFGIIWPLPAEVERLDGAILTDEMAQNMAVPSRRWDLAEPAIGLKLQFWLPDEARSAFMEAFDEQRQKYQLSY